MKNVVINYFYACVISLFRDIQKFYFENQSRARGNNVANALLAVRHVRRDRQGAFLPDTHPEDALVPPLDDLAHPEGEIEGLVPVARGVELAAVGQLARVVHAKLVPNLSYDITPESMDARVWLCYDFASFSVLYLAGSKSVRPRS